MTLVSRAVSLAGLGLGGALLAFAQARPPHTGESFGVPIFPGAVSQPAVAEAVTAYYQPSLQTGQEMSVGVFETAAAFQAVYDFYGPRMESGKWGWRRRTLKILHQTRTLEFLRAQIVRERGERGALPPVFRPLFGDPTWSEQDYHARLEELARRHPEVKILTVEGTRRIAGDPAGGNVRVLIERPYLDLDGMRLVDRTRIQLIKVWQSPGAGR